MTGTDVHDLNPAPSTRCGVVYLQKAPSGHINACLGALGATGEFEILVNLPPTQTDAPFATSAPVDANVMSEVVSGKIERALLAEVRQFDPDVLLIVSWDVAAFRYVAKNMKGACMRVLCMDNQFRCTPKQIGGIALRKLVVQPYFDAAFVPGTRQREFALRLGFPDHRIFEGFYSCDTHLFRRSEPTPQPRLNPDAFLFVGRLVKEKGISTLAEAYSTYRQEAPNPWPLIVSGKGPLSDQLRGLEGVESLGFTQPPELPSLFERASFLVLPSTFEPWGVVVHEAVTAGLGVLTTDRVGAADLFVQSGLNGQIGPAGNAMALADAMTWAGRLPEAERASVAEASLRLASLRSPAGWVEAVREMVALGA